MAIFKFASYGSSVAIFGNAELLSMPAANYTWGNGGGLVSNVWDNTSPLYPEADFLLNLGSITPTAGNQTINLHIAWSPDGGATYPDPQYASGQIADTNLFDAGILAASVTLQATASAKIAVFLRVPLRPGKAKFALQNKSVTLAASANSLVMYPITYTII